MDLLFNRYANPFLFINTLIKSNSLKKGLLDVLKIKDEELMWETYLSLVANPLNKIKSFDEFKSKTGVSNVDVSHSNNNGLQEKEVKDISNQSNNILKNFKPQ